jgi:DNA-3-methyladenine glycosylase II
VLDGREVRIEPAPGGVSVASATAELAQPVRRYLGGPFDLDAFAAFAATEPVLAEVVPALRGFRPPLVPDPFETLVTSITAQQISLRAAASIRNRLIETFGERHELAHAFPSRERLGLAPPEELVAVGFSRRKAEYVVGLLARAGAWPTGDLALRKAVWRFYGDDADVRAVGEHVAPFANLAAHYLLVAHRVHG